MWELTGERGGITKAEFDRYFAKREVAVAIELDVDMRTRLPLGEGGTRRIGEAQADDARGLVDALGNRDLAELLEGVVQGDRCHG